MNNCWCCQKPMGTCLCQDETTDWCRGCSRCTIHCICTQLNNEPAPGNTALRPRDPPAATPHPTNGQPHTNPKRQRGPPHHTNPKRKRSPISPSRRPRPHRSPRNQPPRRHPIASRLSLRPAPAPGHHESRSRPHRQSQNLRQGQLAQDRPHRPPQPRRRPHLRFFQRRSKRRSPDPRRLPHPFRPGDHR